MRQLVEYWAEGLDWPRQEAKLNAFRNQTVELGGVRLLFIEDFGKGPSPMPLLIGHGWPDRSSNSST
jgi:hypothetical protein